MPVGMCIPMAMVCLREKPFQKASATGVRGLRLRLFRTIGALHLVERTYRKIGNSFACDGSGASSRFHKQLLHG